MPRCYASVFGQWRRVGWFEQLGRGSIFEIAGEGSRAASGDERGSDVMGEVTGVHPSTVER